MKKSLKKRKNVFFLYIGIIAVFVFGGNIKNIYAAEIEPDIHKAIKEVMYSYYMRGENIQYNSHKRSADQVVRFSPEEATSQNMNYVVCSGYTQAVYKELLDITIPLGTSHLITYAEENLGNTEVIAYGKRDSNNDIVMKVSGDYIELKNQIKQKYYHI